MKKQPKDKTTKKKNKVLDIILLSLGSLLFLVAAIGVIGKFVSKDAMLFGFRSDVVLTESMASIHDDVKEEYQEKGWTNQIKVHDWIFTTKVSEDDIQVGDIVTYNNPIVGVTTHRVVGIKVINDNKYFTIRADSVTYRDIDGDFKYSSIIGKVTNNAGQFGQVIYFLQSIYGVILIVGLAMICFIYSFLSERIENKNKNTNETQN